MVFKIFTRFVAFCVCFVFIIAIGQRILAVPPPNDLRSGAVTVGIGYSAQLDTSEATTDADDAFLNSLGCNFPATDASVWYTFVGTGDTFRFEVFRSNYSASVLIKHRFSDFGCGVGGMDFRTIPGETYELMVLDDQRDMGGNGGMLDISISLAPPPPDLTVTLDADRFGRLDSLTGIATVSGTYSCRNADSFSAFVQIEQTSGPKFVGIAFNDIRFVGTCDGSKHVWSAELGPSDGKRFHGGKVKSLVVASSSGPYGGGTAYLEQEVILRGD